LLKAQDVAAACYGAAPISDQTGLLSHQGPPTLPSMPLPAARGKPSLIECLSVRLRPVVTRQDTIRGSRR